MQNKVFALQFTVFFPSLKKGKSMEKNVSLILWDAVDIYCYDIIRALPFDIPLSLFAKSPVSVVVQHVF